MPANDDFSLLRKSEATADSSLGELMLLLYESSDKMVTWGVNASLHIHLRKHIFPLEQVTVPTAADRHFKPQNILANLYVVNHRH